MCVCGRSHAGTAGSNPAVVWMSVSCVCYMLSGRGLCDGPVTVQRSPTEGGVSEYDPETLIMRRFRLTMAVEP
jgi:hypothetical protein